MIQHPCGGPPGGFTQLVGKDVQAFNRQMPAGRRITDGCWRGLSRNSFSRCQTKGRETMLFWEALGSRLEGAEATAPTGMRVARSAQRLPFDKRCAAITRSGRRCRGRIRQGSDFCPFHDPAVSPERRRENAAKGGRSRRRPASLVDGYLRKLPSRAAVGEVMGRLYREVRVGTVSPEMGRVLLDILTRALEVQDGDTGDDGQRSSRPTKFTSIRPKLEELLAEARQATRRESMTETRAAPHNDGPTQPPRARPARFRSLTPSTTSESAPLTPVAYT